MVSALRFMKEIVILNVDERSVFIAALKPASGAGSIRPCASPSPGSNKVINQLHKRVRDIYDDKTMSLETSGRRSMSPVFR
jgi:hypothetical protein